MGTGHRFDYAWTLGDASFAKDKGKVFSCFACGGGSTMGYKLAGFDVIGCCELDKRVNDVYVRNHHPKYNYRMDIRELVEMAKAHELPEELYSLDILDGSPPCSTFSMAGLREKAWGKEKRFREGQKKQVLDTLFFDFIDLAKALQPRVVVAENVKGILIGNARAYAQRVISELDEAGYVCETYSLDASEMGVPQRRERVFFIALRKDLLGKVDRHGSIFGCPIDMTFCESPIVAREITDLEGERVTGSDGSLMELWNARQEGDRDMSDTCTRVRGKGSFFNNSYVLPNEVCKTLSSQKRNLIHWDEPKTLSKAELCKVSTFPLDYDFGDVDPFFVCGMSVPPVMMAQVATRVYEAWREIFRGSDL